MRPPVFTIRTRLVHLPSGSMTAIELDTIDEKKTAGTFPTA